MFMACCPKVRQIIPDPGVAGMYIAVTDPGTYLDFVNPVPFRGPTGLIETGVLNADGRISGRAQSAVRPLSSNDFNRIIQQGLDDSAPLLPREAGIGPGFQESQMPFQFEQERERISSLTSRIVRDRVFRKIVLRAYDERCAVTGLSLSTVAVAPRRPQRISGPLKRADPTS
jgi:putative restriction endonuclease